MTTPVRRTPTSRALARDAAAEARARRDAWAMTALGAALLGFVLGAARAGAQDAVPAPGDAGRWRAFAGCWLPAEAAQAAKPDAAPLTCLVPEGRGAVSLVSLADGKVVASERLVADGSRQPVRDEGCSGWQSATWSGDGRRLLLNGEATCDGATRRASGMLAFTSEGTTLVDVRAVRAGDGGGLRVRRLVPANVAVTLPDGRVVDARASRGADEARLAAAGDVGAADVIEAARAVDERVVEGWLLERREGLDLAARDLVALADAKVPARTIDLLVALDNPTRFTVSSARPGRADVARVPQPTTRNAFGMGPGFMGPRSLFPGWGVYDPFFWNPTWAWGGWGLVNPIAAPWYGFNSFFNGPWGGWVGPLGPIVIAPVPPNTGGIPGQPGSGSPGTRPAAINGVGYVRDPGSSRPSMSPGGASMGSGGGTGGGGGGGASTGRTAKPRP